jgi:hypothetical protein
MAVLVPMPMASVRMAIAANEGVRTRERRACRIVQVIGIVTAGD